MNSTRSGSLFLLVAVSMLYGCATRAPAPQPVVKTDGLLIEYYDEDGELVRTMAFDNVENVSGRWVPLRMVIRPVEEPDEMTELTYEDLTFDIELEGDLFSISSLRRQ